MHPCRSVISVTIRQNVTARFEHVMTVYITFTPSLWHDSYSLAKLPERLCVQAWVPKGESRILPQSLSNSYLLKKAQGRVNMLKTRGHSNSHLPRSRPRSTGDPAITCYQWIPRTNWVLITGPSAHSPGVLYKNRYISYLLYRDSETIIFYSEATESQFFFSVKFRDLLFSFGNFPIFEILVWYISEVVYSKSDYFVLVWI